MLNKTKYRNPGPGALGLSRTEELELGIDSLKQRIKEAENEPDAKAMLIEKLIELRSELQELNGEIINGEKGNAAKINAL